MGMTLDQEAAKEAGSAVTSLQLSSHAQLHCEERLMSHGGLSSTARDNSTDHPLDVLGVCSTQPFHVSL